MTLPTPRDESDVTYNAPDFALKVNGVLLPEGVMSSVQNVEYESADGIADVMRVNLVNPPPLIVPTLLAPNKPKPESLHETKIFQPGNVLSLSIGYGARLEHVGTAVIRAVRPRFPSSGFMTIEVVGYSADQLMMDNAPEKPKPKPGSKKSKRKQASGRVFKDMKYSEAVKLRSQDYGFLLDVDDTPGAPTDFIQKWGMSDYAFIKGLSNVTGYLFWVDGDDDGVWTLHFKDPAKAKGREIGQDKTYTFKYDSGEQSSLLAFEPELAISGATTKIKAITKNLQTGKTLEVTIEESNDAAPEVLAAPPRTLNTSKRKLSRSRADHISPVPKLSVIDQALKAKHTTASAIKIFLADFSFEASPYRIFNDQAELEAWVRQWFRRNRENFVLSRGLTIGVESLRARQVHKIEGLGFGLEGEYYFSRVNHKAGSNGYVCDFHCRKVVPELG